MGISYLVSHRGLRLTHLLPEQFRQPRLAAFFPPVGGYEGVGFGVELFAKPSCHLVNILQWKPNVADFAKNDHELARGIGPLRELLTDKQAILKSLAVSTVRATSELTISRHCRSSLPIA